MSKYELFENVKFQTGGFSFIKIILQKSPFQLSIYFREVKVLKNVDYYLLHLGKRELKNWIY